MAVSDAPWKFSQADYSPQQWQRACLIDTGEGPTDSKSRYKLPVLEPSGEVNRHAAHDTARRIREVEGVSADVKAAAARKLVTMYRKDLAEDPPDTLLNMASDDGDRSAPELERMYISHFRGYEVKGSPIEVRSAEKRRIGGYAAMFGKRSVDLGGFDEQIDAACFNKSRADGFPGVICRWNHKDDFLLGTIRSGTLRMDIDNLGLGYEVDLPNCRSDVYEMAERRDLAHSSFAFQTYEDEWRTGDGGFPRRILLSARLIDVAPVTSPAYPDATVGLRSLARFVGAPYEDVVQRARTDELRSFFVRTDNQGQPAPKKPATSGRSALMDILGKRPEDPIGK